MPRKAKKGSPRYYFTQKTEDAIIRYNKEERAYMKERIYNDHISTHIMAFLLSFARGLHKYAPHQYEADWHRPSYPIVHLPDSVVLIVGVGGIGAETARLCSEFGATVIGSDPRVEDKPVGVHELYHPDDILDHLERADFVISTVPETPYTQNYFNSEFFSTMKKGSFL